jgi:hypothetical protein
MRTSNVVIYIYVLGKDNYFFPISRTTVDRMSTFFVVKEGSKENSQPR